MKSYLNFTLGPVSMNEEIRGLGNEQLPYFRTKDFSEITLESEKLIKKIIKTEEDSRVVFLAGSGTAAMEATILNLFTKDDRVLVVKGGEGSFGHRFVKICQVLEIPHETIELKLGEILTKNHLKKHENKTFTGFLINMHETTTGTLYDMKMVKEFCLRNDLFLVVDAIGSFLADSYNMDETKACATLISSQKALALPPGLAFVVLNKNAQMKLKENKIKTIYFDFKEYLLDGKRGQTPFTPAVGIMLQLNVRLKEIEQTGIENIVKNTKHLAKDFRRKIKDLPFDLTSKSASNAVTPISPKGKMKAFEIFEHLKDYYNIFVCPVGGIEKDTMFRVGHIGDLTVEDNDILINAFKEMENKGLI